jgi:quercetin dioxygenase-like cupin family protein
MRVWRGGHTGAPSVPWTGNVTGAAWMDLVHEEDATASALVLTTVTFSPGARTLWHSHAGGQLLVVLAGEGWVGTHEDVREVVRSGDLVWTPGGEDHWHGATDTTTLTHLAVTLGTTQWSDVAPAAG